MDNRAEGGAAAVVAVLVVMVIAAFLLFAFADWDFDDPDVTTVSLDDDEPDVVTVNNPEREVVREREVRETNTVIRTGNSSGNTTATASASVTE